MRRTKSAQWDIEAIRLLIAYYQATGAFTWKARSEAVFRSFGIAPPHNWQVWNDRFAGCPALTARNRAGYLHGSILGTAVYAHRLAWAMSFGAWPLHQIDHLNGNKADNRAENLRDVICAENAKNKPIPSNNHSGTIGVHRDSKSENWVALIRVNQRNHHLGLFQNFEEARRARKAAEVAFGFHENHGRPLA